MFLTNEHGRVDFSFHLIFNDKTYSYTLEELKNKFEPVEIPVTIQCAGNRRSEYNQQVTEKKVNVRLGS